MAAKRQTVLGIVAGVSLIASGAAMPAMAQEVSQGTVDLPAAAQQEQGVQSSLVQLDKVQGTFSFTQEAVTPNATISKVLYKASSYLCGSNVEAGVSADEAQAWSITVSGDVENSYTASVAELAEQGKARIIMGCTCAGNPVDGRASVNAQVEGITVKSILEQARPSADANTITFVSSDGYSVSLPLSYVTQRYSMIVYGINGDEFCDVAGTANQLWLGATSAKYFTQNVSQIILSAEVEAPPAPGTPEAGDRYDNLPNIGVQEAV